MKHYKKNGCWIKPRYVPADALVRCWCADDENWMKLLESELFHACKSDLVMYHVKGEVNKNPIELSYSNGGLFINVDSFKEWATGKRCEEFSEPKKADDTKSRESSVIDDNSVSEIMELDDGPLVYEPTGNKEFDEVAKDHIEWLNQLKQGKGVEPEKPLGSEQEKTYQLIIGAYSQCLAGDHKDMKFDTYEKLHEFIHKTYAVPGLSKSNLDRKSSMARKLLKRLAD